MAKAVDWSYHRNGCQTCGKTVAFLEAEEIPVTTQVNAKKTILADAEALEFARAADELYATKGTKVVHINLKQERPDDEALLKLLIGPSGKLRAPTLKVGKTLIVGFDDATYRKIFG
jgi:arsenate reductase-like glutaredoxin family protein